MLSLAEQLGRLAALLETIEWEDTADILHRTMGHLATPVVNEIAKRPLGRKALAIRVEGLRASTTTKLKQAMRSVFESTLPKSQRAALSPCI